MPNEGEKPSDSTSADGVQKKDIVKGDPQATPRAIQLGRNSELDVTGLTNEQVQELRIALAKGAIAADAKARQVAIGAQAMDKSLETMAHHTKEVAKEEGLAVTITNTREDEMGRTEVIMGNTETASKGKFSRTQTGARDLTWVWFALGILVIVAIVIIAVARH